MGLYDRDYMADSRKGKGFSGWSMVTWLLVINTAVLLIQHLIFDNSIKDFLTVSKESLLRGEVWRLLTFQFSHSNTGHFLGNMLSLFFIGRVFVQVLGPKQVLPAYLIGGLVGAFANILWSLAFGPSSLIGASASVSALAAVLILSIPEQTISPMFLPVQIKVKYLGWAFLGINVLGLLTSFVAPSGVSYISHLGGMAAGWLLVAVIIPKWNARSSQKTGSKPKQRSKIAEAAEIEIKKKRQKETVYLTKKVDAILEKISKEGMQSLTPEERNVLDRSSKKMTKKIDGK